MWQGMHPSVLAAIAQAEAQIAAAQIAANARGAVEPKVAGIRSKGQTESQKMQSQLGLEGTAYGADTQQSIEMMKLMAQLGGQFQGATRKKRIAVPKMKSTTPGGPLEPTGEYEWEEVDVEGTTQDFGKGTIAAQAETQEELAALQAAIKAGGAFGQKQVQTGTETRNILDADGNPIPVFPPQFDPDGNPVYQTEEVPIYETQDKYDFGKGEIKLEKEAQKELAKQQIDAQLGLGTEYGKGTIEKTAAEQRKTEKAQAEAQLGLGDFAGTDAKPGGIIAAQSRAAIEQAAAAAKDTAALRLGTGEWTGKRRRRTSNRSRHGRLCQLG